MSTVRVFVCSAYRDMQAERQHLHDVVFPSVQAKCQEAGITFEVVDPRHTAQSEEQAEGIDGLDQALSDVDGCRPYFIGLFGGHYSRIYIEIPHEVGLRHELVRHFFRCSRTHLETLYGVLKSLDSARAYFYIRKPDVLAQIPDADRKIYEADTEIAKHKLFMMKRAIAAANQPVREYDAQWDDMQKKLVGLEAFGEMVTADLLTLAGIEAPVAAVPMEAVAAEPAPFEEMPMEAAAADAIVPMEAAEDIVPMDEIAEAPVEAVEPVEEFAAEPMQVEEPLAFVDESPTEQAPLFEDQPAVFGEEQPVEDMQIVEEESQEVVLSEESEVVEEDIDLASIFDDDKKKG